MRNFTRVAQGDESRISQNAPRLRKTHQIEIDRHLRAIPLGPNHAGMRCAIVTPRFTTNKHTAPSSSKAETGRIFQAAPAGEEYASDSELTRKVQPAVNNHRLAPIRAEL